MTRAMVRGGTPNQKSAKVRDTEVVHVKSGAFNVKDPTHVYIGRAMPGFDQSIWGNPFRMDTMKTVTTDRGSGAPKKERGKAYNMVSIERDGTREDCIQKYSDWVKTQPQLMARIPELKGKRLGCWCHPKPCHGDILKAMADET